MPELRFHLSRRGIGTGEQHLLRIPRNGALASRPPCIRAAARGATAVRPKSNSFLRSEPDRCHSGSRRLKMRVSTSFSFRTSLHNLVSSSLASFLNLMSRNRPFRPDGLDAADADVRGRSRSPRSPRTQWRGPWRRARPATTSRTRSRARSPRSAGRRDREPAAETAAATAAGGAAAAAMETETTVHEGSRRDLLRWV